ncbi:MAG TPA: metallopeptidase TldD-related protein [Candidatus Polarisedimenticolia bacterium]|nr:metallopeptidase TldD-related protein [Candidatus Polarisedimenticolia bacterium]
MIQKEAGRESKLSAFLAGEPRDLEWAEALVEQALLAGAREAEVYLKTSSSTGILLQHGFATLSGGSERGAALRVFDDVGRFGHAFASWRNDETAGRLTRAAVAALKQQEDSRGGWSPAPRPEQAFARVPGVVDEAVLAREPEQKRRSLERVLETSFRAAAPRPMASFRDGITRVAVANSRGVKACFTRTLAMATLTIAQPGGWTLQAERVGCGMREADLREEAQRLSGLAEAREEEVACGDLLLEPPAAASLIRWLERELPRAETEDQPGGGFRRVASEAVDLIDDPLLPEGVASAPFDGEGHATRPRVAVKSGILMSESAAEAGTAAGRMVRPSYRDLPRPGSTNLVLRPGERDQSALLAEIEEGFLLAALETDASVDQPEQEARWRGVGWRVRHGETGGEVRRLLFRASPRALLEGIQEAGNRLRFSLLRSTALGAPALLIRPGR